MRYEQQLMFAYNEELDCYVLIEDDGRGFPYEFYDEITLMGKPYYDLYLDDKKRYPTVSTDKWVDMNDVLTFFKSLKSKTEEGTQKNQALEKLVAAYLNQTNL